jgi:hypothetical protein
MARSKFPRKVAKKSRAEVLHLLVVEIERRGSVRAAAEKVADMAGVELRPEALRSLWSRAKANNGGVVPHSEVGLLKTHGNQLFTDVEEQSFLTYLWWHQNLGRPISTRCFSRFLVSFMKQSRPEIDSTKWNTHRYSHSFLHRYRSLLSKRTAQALTNGRNKEKTGEAIEDWCSQIELSMASPRFPHMSAETVFNGDEIRVVDKKGKFTVISFRGLGKVDKQHLREQGICSLLPFFNAAGDCVLCAIVWPIQRGTQTGEFHLDHMEEKISRGELICTRSTQHVNFIHLFREKGVLNGETFGIIAREFRRVLTERHPGRDVTLIMDNASYHVADDHKLIVELQTKQPVPGSICRYCCCSSYQLPCFYFSLARLY